jgi:hypothetical protein
MGSRGYMLFPTVKIQIDSFDSCNWRCCFPKKEKIDTPIKATKTKSMKRSDISSSTVSEMELIETVTKTSHVYHHHPKH